MPNSLCSFLSSPTGWNQQHSPREITFALKLSTHSACAIYDTSKAPTTQRFLTPQPAPTKNQKVRALTKQPTLSHHIHKAQLKLFGHILRSHPNSIERNCCFTSSFQYREETVGAGLRPGRRRVHWTEQCTKLLWHWLLKSSRPPATHSPTFPYSYLQAHRKAVDRQFWSTLVRLPTCKTLLEARSFALFSQPCDVAECCC